MFDNIGKVLYVGNHAGIFLSHRLPVFKKIRELGGQVHVAVPFQADQLSENIDDHAIESIRRQGFIVHDLAFHRAGVNIADEMGILLSIGRLYRAIKPDLVYHATQKPVLYGSLMARILGMPAVMNSLTGLGYVFTDTSVKARLLKFIMKMVYRFTLNSPNAFNFFHNNDDRQYFISKGIVTRQNSKVIKGSGVCLQTYHRVPEPESEMINIVFPARLLKDKGVHEFVDAAGLIKTTLNANFLLVGDVDTQNPSSVSAEEVRGWEKKGIIEWKGWQKDMPAVYRNCHIVCLPSYREGMSKSLIEALASGRPIVTTDVPGCREIIANDNGVLVPSKNVETLVSALSRLIRDKEMRVTMGQKSRELAESEFSIDIVIKKTLEMCKILDRGIRR